MSQSDGPTNQLLALTRASWLPLSLRKKFARLLPVQAGQRFRLPLFEGSFLGITGTLIDDKVWRYGLHEASTIRLMRRLLADDRRAGRAPVLLDVGTNTGVHLVACAGLCDAALGCEPWAPMRHRAEASLAASGFSHVRLLPCGLGEASADLPFAVPQGTNLGTGSFATGQGELMAQVRRGDEICAEEGLLPTLIKIDTEGFELPVLRGLSEVLRTAQPAVVFEVGGTGEERAATVRAVSALLGDGYRFFGLRRSLEQPRLFPLRPSTRCENALAWPLRRGAQPPSGG